MDPITQGALGAAFAEALLGRRLKKRAWLIGAAAGMAPDLDVFIRSPSDPLVAIEFHRHFTHALSFAPIGAALAALPFLLWWSRNRDDTSWSPRWIYLAALVGWLTHAPLDACTSYGTLLFWPFSDARVAWSFMAIIDPLYTVPLLVGVALTRRYGPRAAGLGLLVAHLYMAACFAQQLRAERVQRALLEERAHEPIRQLTSSYFLSNILWRSAYQIGDALHVDLVIVPWIGEPTVLDGHELKLLLEPRGAWSSRSEAFELMRWFSGGWLGEVERADGARLLCDLRLSTHPTKTAPVICLGVDDDGQLYSTQVRDDMSGALDAALDHDPKQRVP